MPFSTLGLGPNILKALQEAGYTEPTPIQAAAIPQIMSGHDLIGIAQTGTGKTAAFVLPILAKLIGLTGGGNRQCTRALVLAPTRELAAQIEENVRAYASHLPLRMATVFGGVGERPQIEALKSGVDLIIATPGRLLDLMKQRFGDFSGLEFLVLDEADRMLDMGFLPDIRRIVKAMPKKRKTLLFSATLSKEIESLTHEFLQSPKLVEIGRRANPAETVTQLVYEVSKSLKPALLVHLMQDPGMDTVLVFSRTKHGADRIARALEQKGIKTATLHSNRSQNQRIRALKDFKSGVVRVLVATDIAARGIDVDGISHVVNYDFPMHSEDYVHRIGRTGRAQQIGDAISFVTPEDHGPLRTLERFIGRGIVRKRAEGFNYSAAPVAGPSEESSGGRGRERRGSEGGGGSQSQGGRSQNRGNRSGGEQRDRGPRGSKSGGERQGGGKKGGTKTPSVRGVPGGMTWSPRRG
ncbi:MAG: DEAD/DEAH box helicase [Verrucomicrobiota bacterium]